MADVYAQTSGNWSDPATWSGGVLPGENDVAVANGFIVTVDQDVTVQRIRNNLGTTGGNFEISSVGAGVTRNFITTNGITSSDVGANDILLISSNGGVVNLGSSSIQVSAGFNILRITGVGVRVISTGNISSSNSTAVNISSICEVQFNDLSYSSSSFAVSASVAPAESYPDYSRGKLIFRNVSNSSNFGGRTLSISGPIDCTVLNVTGSLGSNSSSETISLSNNASLTVLENVVAGNGTSSAIVIAGNSGSGVVDVQGSVTASSTSRAIYVSNNNSANFQVRVGGPIIDSPTRKAIFSPILTTYNEEGRQISWTVYDTSGSPVVLKNYHTESPEPSNVRKGVAYGTNNQIIGTMEVPHPNSVSLGVPVDGTTGNAILTGDEVLNSEIAPGVPIKTRINNVATISSTGEQLKAGVS
jgi:hypothetical protein